MPLAEQKCEPYHAGTQPLAQDRAEELLEEVPLWTLEDKLIQREFRFDDFVGSIAFVNKVADLAEEQDHHPDIHISYNRVLLELSTHKVGGLTDNDFILAAKVDALA